MKSGLLNLNKWKVVLILALLVMGFFWKTVFFGSVTIPSDILENYHPWRGEVSLASEPHNTVIADMVNIMYPFETFVGQSMKNLDLALWNPYIFSGTPFMANSSSLFYPPLAFLRLIFSPLAAHQISIMLHLFLMGLFMYLLMKSFGLNDFSSLIAGLIWMFNGYIVVWLGWRFIVIGGSLFPLLFLVFKKSIDESNYFYSLLAGIILALILTAGFYIGYYIIIFLAMYFIFNVFIFYRDAEQRKIKRLFVSFSIVVLLGLALAMIQLLPMAEFMLCSTRSSRLLTEMFPKLWKSCLLLSTFFVPKLFGDPVSPNTFLFAGNLFNEFQGYVGIFPLVLAVFAAVYRKNKYVYFFTGMAVISVLLSFKTPLSLLFYYLVPGFNNLEPGRVLFLYAFSISVLVGFGVDYLLSARESTGRRFRFTMVCGIFFTFTLVVFGILNVFLYSQREWVIQFISSHIKTNVPYELIYANLKENMSILNLNFLIFIFVFGLSILSLHLYIGKVLKNGYFKVAVFSLIVFDLFWFGINYNTHTEADSVYPEVPGVEFLKKDKSLFRVMSLNDKESTSLVMPFSTKMPYCLQDVGGYDIMYPEHYLEFMGLAEHGNAAYREKLFDYHYIFLFRYNSRLLNLLNVKYIITFPDKSIEDSRFELVYEGNVRIYRNNECLPRAFIVPCSITLNSKEEVFNKLLDAEFDPAENVILAEKAPRTEWFDTGNSSAQVVSYKPNEVNIITEMESEGFLVLADSYYRGWQVFVDGKKDKIYRAYHTLRCVYLPSGEHKVEFIYRPKSFIIGRNISLSSILLVVGVMICKRLAVFKSR